MQSDYRILIASLKEVREAWAEAKAKGQENEANFWAAIIGERSVQIIDTIRNSAGTVETDSGEL